MTPKEKAKELVDKFSNVALLDSYEAKLCSLIAVDTVLWMASHYATIDYWNEVKQEIEKL
jgi:hypothetical protein